MNKGLRSPNICLARNQGIVDSDDHMHEGREPLQRGRSQSRSAKCGGENQRSSGSTRISSNQVSSTSFLLPPGWRPMLVLGASPASVV